MGMIKNIINRLTFGVLAVVALTVLLLGDAEAVELTLKQERLIGMPNRFIIEVSEFESDGAFTPLRAKTFAEKVIKVTSLRLAEEASEPPIGKMILSIVKGIDSKGDRIYKLDLNVYSIDTVNTEYDLRRGTIWKIGSYTEKPGRNFPRGIEKRIAKLIRYFSYDFFQANPYLKSR